MVYNSRVSSTQLVEKRQLFEIYNADMWKHNLFDAEMILTLPMLPKFPNELVFALKLLEYEPEVDEGENDVEKKALHPIASLLPEIEVLQYDGLLRMLPIAGDAEVIAV